MGLPSYILKGSLWLFYALLWTTPYASERWYGAHRGAPRYPQPSAIIHGDPQRQKRAKWRATAPPVSGGTGGENGSRDSLKLDSFRIQTRGAFQGGDLLSYPLRHQRRESQKGVLSRQRPCAYKWHTVPLL